MRTATATATVTALPTATLTATAVTTTAHLQGRARRLRARAGSVHPVVAETYRRRAAELDLEALLEAVWNPPIDLEMDLDVAAVLAAMSPRRPFRPRVHGRTAPAVGRQGGNRRTTPAQTGSSSS
jgi:hypothetical protein